MSVMEKLHFNYLQKCLFSCLLNEVVSNSMQLGQLLEDCLQVPHVQTIFLVHHLVAQGLQIAHDYDLKMGNLQQFS